MKPAADNSKPADDTTTHTMTSLATACGQLIGGIGGGAAALWAAPQVWPLITSTIPGGGGVVVATLASLNMFSVGCGVGSCVGATVGATVGLTADLLTENLGGTNSNNLQSPKTVAMDRNSLFVNNNNKLDVRESSALTKKFQ
jgi:gas vesicle protein